MIHVPRFWFSLRRCQLDFRPCGVCQPPASVSSDIKAHPFYAFPRRASASTPPASLTSAALDLGRVLIQPTVGCQPTSNLYMRPKINEEEFIISWWKNSHCAKLMMLFKIYARIGCPYWRLICFSSIDWPSSPRLFTQINWPIHAWRLFYWRN